MNLNGDDSDDDDNVAGCPQLDLTAICFDISKQIQLPAAERTAVDFVLRSALLGKEMVAELLSVFECKQGGCFAVYSWLFDPIKKDTDPNAPTTRMRRTWNTVKEISVKEFFARMRPHKNTYVCVSRLMNYLEKKQLVAVVTRYKTEIASKSPFDVIIGESAVEVAEYVLTVDFPLTLLRRQANGFNVGIGSWQTSLCTVESDSDNEAFVSPRNNAEPVMADDLVCDVPLPKDKFIRVKLGNEKQ